MNINDVFSLTESLETGTSEEKIKKISESFEVLKRDLLIYFETVEERIKELENR